MKDYFAKGLFGRDLLGSVVVFLVALPLCMGVAIASGMPPAAGLITGIVGGILVGAIAGSPLQVSGPAAGLAVLVFELVRQHGAEALGPVIVIAGVIQFIAGLCRAGVWFRMVAPAVVAGMLSGIGILIVASQLHVLMDAEPLARGLENFAALPGALWEAVTGEGTGVAALAVGLATIGIMLAWDKLRPAKLKFLPGALLAVVGVTAAVQFGGIAVNLVDVPSNLLSAIHLPDAEWLGMLIDPTLVLAGVTFAFIASAETLLSAAAVDRMHDGVRTNFNRELGAQGVGNFVCGLLGALPMTGVIVRSAANVQAGSATRLATMLHGSWLLVFAMLLPWLMRMTPVACLAGILVYTGVKMVNLGQIRTLAQYGRGTAVVYVVTMLAIVATDLLTGVVIGFAASLFRLALLSSRLDIGVKQSAENEVALDLQGSATFLKVPAMARTLEQIPPGTQLTLNIDRLQHVDQAYLELLKEWARGAKAKGSELVVDWHLLQQRCEGARPQPREAALA
ncbi:SulP family inorganic anion transporter [Coralloluteibacterium stylophorae]|uniref:SulP family inorganic anion transporter n=1 Tax=Coralloluteibacterium stylophorae TaxID=1776034 RepID=A0A8J8AWC0_9GAMM|nr:SulP family inorganic anion transporter [Coralloluteibacterium stylophorae]MBS7458135.1 SulP family inorganic anion transporter [Coralloluteibacterium stylophorae]